MTGPASVELQTLAWKECQEVRRRAAGTRWREHNLVFASEVGTQLDAANVRRAFRKVAKAAGLAAEEWTPRELRHSFVSLLSSSGVPIEDIAALAGHVQHGCDGEGLPPRATAGAANRGEEDGRDLPRSPAHGDLASRFASRVMREAGLPSGKPASDLRWTS